MLHRMESLDRVLLLWHYHHESHIQVINSDHNHQWFIRNLPASICFDSLSYLTSKLLSSLCVIMAVSNTSFLASTPWSNSFRLASRLCKTTCGSVTSVFWTNPVFLSISTCGLSTIWLSFTKREEKSFNDFMADSIWCKGFSWLWKEAKRMSLARLCRIQSTLWR